MSCFGDRRLIYFLCLDICRNYTQRKRSRCNTPSDMESGLISLRSSMCDLVVLPAECLNTDLRQVNVTQVSLRSSMCDLMVLPAECLNTDLWQVNVSKVRVKAKGQKGKMYFKYFYKKINDLGLKNNKCLVLVLGHSHIRSNAAELINFYWHTEEGNNSILNFKLTC